MVLYYVNCVQWLWNDIVCTGCGFCLYFIVHYFVCKLSSAKHTGHFKFNIYFFYLKFDPQDKQGLKCSDFL